MTFKAVENAPAFVLIDTVDLDLYTMPFPGFLKKVWQAGHYQWESFNRSRRTDKLTLAFCMTR